MDPAHPHDSLFELAFSEPRDAATLLRSALPAEVSAAIGWDRLRRIDAAFVDTGDVDAHRDLLFAAPLGRGEVLLYVLLEHKSGAEPLTAFQMLRYVVRILEQQLPWPQGRHLRRLPPVLPFLLHHGRRPWTEAVQLRPLFDVRGVPRAVAAFILRHQPQLRLLLDDVAAQSDSAIEQRRLSLVARLSIHFLKHLRRARPIDLEAHLLRVRDLMTRLLDDPRGATIAAALCFYAATTTKTDRASVRTAIHRALAPDTAETVMNTMQKWFLQERNEELAETLLRLMTKKFGSLPPDVAHRVRSAERPDLDLWTDRILDATSVADLLRDDRPASD